MAYWCGQPPSLRLPLSLLAGLQQQGLPGRLIFDASTPYQLDAGERPLYAALLARTAACVQVPSGCSADALILQEARAQAARIISRDRFRDHRRSYKSLIHNPQRLFGGEVAEDQILIPALDLVTPLSPTATEAFARLA